jgi:hypothetical protein
MPGGVEPVTGRERVLAHREGPLTATSRAPDGAIRATIQAATDSANDINSFFRAGGSKSNPDFVRPWNHFGPVKWTPLPCCKQPAPSAKLPAFAALGQQKAADWAGIPLASAYTTFDV